MTGMTAVTQEKISRLDALISSAASVGIIAHQHPDGDAVGSTAALKHYLERCRGLKAYVCLPDDASATLNFIACDGHGYTVQERHREAARRRLRSCDLIFCLDCASLERTGNIREVVLPLQTPKVLIDHHLSPREEQFDLVFSDTEVSSASELLYHVLMAMPDIHSDATLLPKRSLSSLMAGMTTDTNNFANSVFPTTFTMASTLIAAGVDRDAIIYHLYNEYRENRVRLMAFLLKERLVITDQGVAYIILSAKRAASYGIRDGELEGLVNIPLTIGKVRLSIFVKEDRDLYRVSIRSKKGTSANELAARYFNGGGHENAAGGRLHHSGATGSSAKVAAYIEKVCSEYFSK